jgi:hypothetical protein
LIPCVYGITGFGTMACCVILAMAVALILTSPLKKRDSTFHLSYRRVGVAESIIGIAYRKMYRNLCEE